MMHVYALKMWGRVMGDTSLESRFEANPNMSPILRTVTPSTNQGWHCRSNLQLSVLSRSLQHYYLYQNNNEVQPTQFIGNKVAGILFENKVDHTTFFSPDVECIQGIHMIPLLAATPFVRCPEFVEEEWNVFFSNGRVDDIQNAWKGIIYGSYATVNPKLAWEFFSSKQFDPSWLDGGASLTWFLAFSAGKLYSPFLSLP